jgi:hypothetical protein
MIGGLFAPTPAVSQATTVPAPVGGLNTFDSLANMPKGDAVLMKNFYPQPYGLLVRKGYKEHVTGVTGSIESLLTWQGRTNSDLKMWAASTDGKLYDVTGTTATPSSVVTGLNNARWQFTNLVNAAGNHMVAFNGNDDGLWYNGSALARLTAGNGTDSGTWANVDPADLVQCTVHQRRLWAVEVNSTKGWYLAPDAVFGSATVFDFGALFGRGGYLMSLASWTIDDGSGADDLLIAISSQGEVAVYRGIDPSSSTTWALQGVYYVGAPIGRRCVTKLAGEAILLTREGIVALSEALASTRLNPSEYNGYASKIRQTLSELISEVGTVFGWEPFVYPASNMLIVNVPSSTRATQVVSNTILRAWTMFDNQEASCWALLDSAPYFANGEKVYRAWFGNLDGADRTTGAGSPVRAEAIQAFNYFDTPGKNKHVKMFRPTFVTDGDYSLSAVALLDFDFTTIPTDSPLPFVPGSTWDAAVWDVGIWSGTVTVNRYWIQGRGIGMAIALRMVVSTQYNTYWVSTDWLMEAGGVL